jgi:hypothetical protein
MSSDKNADRFEETRFLGATITLSQDKFDPRVRRDRQVYRFLKCEPNSGLGGRCFIKNWIWSSV